MIYLASLNDVYDTPLFASSSASEMASYLGITTNCLYSRISKIRKGTTKGKRKNAVMVYAFPEGKDGGEKNDEV